MDTKATNWARQGIINQTNTHGYYGGEKNITCKGIVFIEQRCQDEADKNRSFVAVCPLRNGNEACWITRRSPGSRKILLNQKQLLSQYLLKELNAEHVIWLF